MNETQGELSEWADPSHHTVNASTVGGAECVGTYLSTRVDRLIHHVIARDRDGSDQEFTLIHVVVCNLWDHRIVVGREDFCRLVDSEGYQHSMAFRKPEYNFEEIIPIRINRRKTQFHFFESLDFELEGKAKTKGWLWFPRLGSDCWVHRVIFRHDVFSPGCTSGSVRDAETLEIRLSRELARGVNEDCDFCSLDKTGKRKPSTY
jgi:hypothetical protein